MRVKPTTPEHAGAVERLTAYAEWLRNSEPNSPYDASCNAKDDDIVAVLAALTASEARVLELVGALEPFARFNLDGFNSIMLEVVPASPDNPSRRIEPIWAEHFRRARSALNATSPGMGEVKE